MAESRRMHRLAGGVNEIQHAEIFDLADRGGSAANTVRGGAMLYDASRAGNAERHGSIRSGGRAAARCAPAPKAAARRCSSMPMAGGWCCATTGAAAGSRASRPIATCGAATSQTRSFVEWHLLYLMRRAGLPVPMPIAACYRRTGRYTLQRRPADRADPGRQLAGRAPDAGAAAAEQLDRDRPLPAPLPRRRGVSCRSQRAQRAAERRAGSVAGRLRSRPPAPPGPVVRHQSGAACAARSRRSPMRCRRSDFPRPTGPRC